MAQNVFFTNPVLAQQRMADDQLPLQQEALRLQELAQLLQASQQNQRTQSEERQNKERVGAQRYQTETWGGVSMGQNENVRRRDDNDRLTNIEKLALERERIRQEAELQGRSLDVQKQIEEIRSRRSLLRPQDAVQIERDNAEIERANKTASGLAQSINDASIRLEEEDVKNLAKEYQGRWDWFDPNADKVELAKKEAAKRRAQGVYARAAIAGMGARPEDVFGMLEISGGVAKPIISPKISMGQSYGGGQGSGGEIAKLLGLVGGLSEADLSPSINLPAFGYEADMYGRPVNPAPRSEAVRNLPASVEVDQFGRPVQSSGGIPEAVRLLAEQEAARAASRTNQAPPLLRRYTNGLGVYGIGGN